MGLVTLTFDRLTLKLVCKSHLRRGTFSSNLGTLTPCYGALQIDVLLLLLVLWVLELFAMYSTARRMKAALIFPFPTGAGA